MGVFAGIIKIVPFVLTLIQGVEGLFAKGTDKKNAVLNSATSVLGILQAEGIISNATQTAFPTATSAFIDATVTYLNAIGAFPPSSAALPTATSTTGK